MIAPKVLGHEEIKRRLETAGFKDTGKRFSGDSGNFAVWITAWGEPLMVPEEGPDKVCAEFVLLERVEKVLATKPKR